MKHIFQPEFVIDKKKVITNIKLMKSKADKSGVTFRPHFKTHQSIEIGRWFRKFGVERITVSSLRMAEYFATDNWNDITVAFPVNVLETERINRLAEKVKLNLLVESVDAVKILSDKLKHKINVYIKIDVGGNRTGIKSKNIKEILSVYQSIKCSNKLMPEGLLTHAGNTYHAKSKTEIINIYKKSTAELNEIRNLIDPSLLISIGDTPSCSLLNHFENVDEIRPGNFVFYDYMQYKLNVCKFNQIAAVVLLPVVAKHKERNEIVVYGGAVHLSKDYIEENGQKKYGQLVRLKGIGWSEIINGCYVKSISQEHGIIKLSTSEFNKIKIGSLVAILPVHSCLTANLMKKYLTTSGEQIFTMNKNCKTNF